MSNLVGIHSTLMVYPYISINVPRHFGTNLGRWSHPLRTPTQLPKQGGRLR